MLTISLLQAMDNSVIKWRRNGVSKHVNLISLFLLSYVVLEMKKDYNE